jgi:hypothetical protein
MTTVDPLADPERERLVDRLVALLLMTGNSIPDYYAARRRAERMIETAGLVGWFVAIDDVDE